MASEVKVPALGESVNEATLGEWLKQPGDAVALDEPIASLETDKVAIEVPSPIAGILSVQIVAAGDTVQVGAVIALVEATSGAVAAKPAAAPVAAGGAGGSKASTLEPKTQELVEWKKRSLTRALIEL